MRSYSLTDPVQSVLHTVLWQKQQTPYLEILKISAQGDDWEAFFFP